ncbi:MAG: hypothetical protein BWY12_01031 [candidate division BRC1 bacterium ADurb.Bin183]|jgi:hypothetical protein|nr:MAG: hypothetical protein BWY12_01031 [candidate division BRC1 bacterium ADurb.Bin183]
MISFNTNVESFAWGWRQFPLLIEFDRFGIIYCRQSNSPYRFLNSRYCLSDSHYCRSNIMYRSSNNRCRRSNIHYFPPRKNQFPSDNAFRNSNIINHINSKYFPQSGKEVEIV